MGAVAGLLAGVGLLLIWLACTSDPPQWRSRRSRLLADILVQAGAGRTSPTMFVLGSMGLGMLIGLVFLGTSRAWPVALSFAVIFTAIPFLIISSRARSRRTRLRQVWPEAVDTLVSGVRAGMSLPEALTNLGERGPEAVRPQFRLRPLRQRLGSSQGPLRRPCCGSDRRGSAPGPRGWRYGPGNTPALLVSDAA